MKTKSDLKTQPDKLVELKVGYRGTRSYLQSSDIFSACCDKLADEEIGQDAKLLITFRNFVSSKIYFFLGETPGAPEHFKQVGNCSLHSTKSTSQGGLFVDANATPVSIASTPDFDDQIKKDMEQLGDQSASVIVPNEFNVAQISVTLGKLILLHEVSDQFKWVVVKMSMPVWQSRLSGEQLTSKLRRVSSRNLAELEFWYQNEKVGSIFYQAMQK